ncbi:hypothetical protein HPB50_000829 [Hyalomma asiaticum]|uniref:Uncharacterized protein n=1 Tax=Hyalomma asiaticum TaxID=266040 RepID=A0ACB7RWA3_HYAAI|nr:hypothetical protein HPB50_000829 [Hyalomma asiaticum]
MLPPEPRVNPSTGAAGLEPACAMCPLAPRRVRNGSGCQTNYEHRKGDTADNAAAGTLRKRGGLAVASGRRGQRMSALRFHRVTLCDDRGRRVFSLSP